MIYRSNLSAPDLHRHFTHAHIRPMPHSSGHSVPSDWADKAVDDPVYGLFKRCGCMTPDECAILYHVARQTPHGLWLDLGSHTCFTTCFLAEAGNHVIAVDNMYAVGEFADRALANVKATGHRQRIQLFDGTSDDFFAQSDLAFSGIVIDADHDSPAPLRDAKNAATHLEENGLVLFHDASGEPVQEGIRYLIQQGFQHKVYWTPHVLALCWRGEFTPPEHMPDLDIQARLSGSYRV